MPMPIKTIICVHFRMGPTLEFLAINSEIKPERMAIAPNITDETAIKRKPNT